MPDIPITTEPPAKNRRWLRNLRITVSVFFALVTVALCVLWVRSYWREDSVIRIDTSGRGVKLESDHGMVFFGIGPVGNIQAPLAPTWAIWSNRIPTAERDTRDRKHEPSRFEFQWRNYAAGFSAQIPHWCPTLICALICTAIMIPWRFSLRTLLIGTTLIGVVMGLIVWSLRG